MYGKLFVQMYDGTLGTKGPWEALVTFQQFIILADQEGEVDMTPEAISRRSTIPLEIILKGIEELEKPDPSSRSPAEDGRRIVLLSDNRTWGWRIVNHAHYRNIRSQEDRREYMRNYQRIRRSKANVNNGKQCKHVLAMSTKAEAEAEAEADQEPVGKYIISNSVPSGTGKKTPPVTEPSDVIFGYGVPLLTTAGTPEKQARSFLGGLRKQHGDAALIDKLRECMNAKPLQPLEWLAAALPPNGATGRKAPAIERFDEINYGETGLL